jgi:hypothetical protein
MLLPWIVDWWRRPPATQRLLAAMSDEWRAPLDIMDEAKISVSGFYVRVPVLEHDGFIESRWEDGPRDPKRGFRRRRLYRLKQCDAENRP